MYSFKEQINIAADYLINKRNPYDGGWGLNIEKMMQTSSIVNTTEAIVVINRAGFRLNDSERTEKFLRDALVDHPSKRGDNLRYYVFGIIGLLEVGVSIDDPFLLSYTNLTEKRILEDIGWAEHSEDTEPRIWQTFLCLIMLERIYGKEYVEKKYNKCLENILSIGKANNLKWGWQLTKPESVSLAATAYALILSSLFFPDEQSIIAQIHQNVIEMLNKALDENKVLEVEPISGTDWYHYSFSWALISLHTSSIPLNKQSFDVTIKTLGFIEKTFNGKGYCEPNSNYCNVRSIYNSVLTLDAVINGFDPYFYLLISKFLK